MAGSTATRTRMTHDICADSASSGSPLAPPKASPCVLDRLDLARPRAPAAAKSAIWAGAEPEDAVTAAPPGSIRLPFIVMGTLILLFVLGGILAKKEKPK